MVQFKGRHKGRGSPMDTIVKERAVVAAVSILVLGPVIILGGLYSAPADEEPAGAVEEPAATVETGVTESPLSQSGQAGGQHEEDTYEEEENPSGPETGGRYVLGFYVDDEYIHPSSYDRMVKYGKSIS